jgi:hypothetical protein
VLQLTFDRHFYPKKIRFSSAKQIFVVSGSWILQGGHHAQTFVSFTSVATYNILTLCFHQK